MAHETPPPGETQYTISLPPSVVSDLVVIANAGGLHERETLRRLAYKAIRDTSRAVRKAVDDAGMSEFDEAF